MIRESTEKSGKYLSSNIWYRVLFSFESIEPFDIPNKRKLVGWISVGSDIKIFRQMIYCWNETASETVRRFHFLLEISILRIPFIQFVLLATDFNSFCSGLMNFKMLVDIVFLWFDKDNKNDFSSKPNEMMWAWTESEERKWKHLCKISTKVCPFRFCVQ